MFSMFSREEKQILGLLVLALVALALTLASIHTLIVPNAYKQGQVDAINGIINYELVEQPDRSIVWEKKESDDE